MAKQRSCEVELPLLARPTESGMNKRGFKTARQRLLPEEGSRSNTRKDVCRDCMNLAHLTAKSQGRKTAPDYDDTNL